MIRFILQGILRDKTRSLFPFLVVTVGVALVVFAVGFMEGVFMGMVDTTANLDTGHIRFVNKPFYDEEHLNPLDRALTDEKETGRWLKENSDPDIQWSPRIRWSAIADVPDENGETKSQTPIIGMALDLLSPNSAEVSRLHLKKTLEAGRLPQAPKEILLGYELARTLEVGLGQTVTLLGQTFDGGMAADNYKVVGFVRFGVFAMDKKMALIDIKDAQDSFYMEDTVTDWLGFLPSRVSYKKYKKIKEALQTRLEKLKQHPPKDWAKDDVPIVLSVLEQRNLDNLNRVFQLVKKIFVGIFVLLMVLVLWNAGLLNGIHRYGELGLLLAMGQTHKKLVWMMGVESLSIGILGSIAGCLIGGGVVYYLQEVGINMGDAFAQTGMMLSDTVRGRVTLESFLMGIVPGLTASVLGSLFASVALFQRSEANLFRELEAG
jgi:putative ABC transport system permease protein